MVMYPQNTIIRVWSSVANCLVSQVSTLPHPRSLAIRHRKGHVVCVRLSLQHTFISFFKLALSGVESRHVCKMVRIV